MVYSGDPTAFWKKKKFCCSKGLPIVVLSWNTIILLNEAKIDFKEVIACPLFLSSHNLKLVSIANGVKSLQKISGTASFTITDEQVNYLLNSKL